MSSRLPNRAPPGSLLKPPRSARKPKVKDKSRPGDSEAHLECIRQLPCVVCGAQPRNDPHHLKCSGERGMGKRSTDKWAVPMCRACHSSVENVGAKKELNYFNSHNLMIIDIAYAIWFNSGDLERMTKIIETHRDLARKKNEGTACQ